MFFVIMDNSWLLMFDVFIVLTEVPGKKHKANTITGILCVCLSLFLTHSNTLRTGKYTGWEAEYCIFAAT